MTGGLLCLYVKLFLPSFFNSVDFGSVIFCIVLAIQLADKNVFRELGVLSDSKVQEYSFRPPKKYKPTKQTFWCTRSLHGIVWNSGRLNYSELSDNLRRAVNGENFAEGFRKKQDSWQFFLEVENLEDHDCPKVQDLVDEKIWICSSYPFNHKITLHTAERKAKLFCNWIMRHLMF